MTWLTKVHLEIYGRLPCLSCGGNGYTAKGGFRNCLIQEWCKACKGRGHK